ncbi:uncharacterized protein LOC109515426 isoform X1 [Hippocampus comes]|uniref:uncharacterized protein LOC109515426 isoform X1 n=2 Tax=Hippocampus comes TaxID=109280 RepID=UPI00094F3021|nr:PREDICTED: uncharacterized protein LOC109515426 isoform X1 [Hippocampus comes]
MGMSRRRPQEARAGTGKRGGVRNERKRPGNKATPGRARVTPVTFFTSSAPCDVSGYALRSRTAVIFAGRREATFWEAGAMAPLDFLCWRAATLLLLLLPFPNGVACVSVHMPNEGPMYVIPGAALVLRAHIQYGSPDELMGVTWEREPESGAPGGRAALATCPGGGAPQPVQCASTHPNVRASVEQQTSILHVGHYAKADAGVYAVSVTGKAGESRTARVIVREYEAVHHVTVSINVSHSSLVCGEAWGTEPQFSWLHERDAVTSSVGRVSPDGATLVVTKVPICGHFTCVVSNKLGYSSATYTAAPCEPSGISGSTVAIVCLVVLQVLGGGLVFLLWRRYRNRHRGDRLREHVDDNI